MPVGGGQPLRAVRLAEVVARRVPVSAACPVVDTMSAGLVAVMRARLFVLVMLMMSVVLSPVFAQAAARVRGAV